MYQSLVQSAGAGACAGAARREKKRLLASPANEAYASHAATRHESGRAIYNFRCYFCHGYSGDAKTLASTFLSPPPRGFTTTPFESLSRLMMISAVTQGRPNTAMMAFAKQLTAPEIEAVVDFIRVEFMENSRRNTRYHTVENGWPNHEKYQAAFPFARGDIALDTAWEALTAEQQAGKKIFLTSCVSCHDRSHVTDEGAIWESRPLSFPRNGYSPSDNTTDTVSGASAYAAHDIAPRVTGLSVTETLGQELFQKNCAFCHAADGTGRNWIGSFLEAHPRDLTGTRVTAMSDAQITAVIRDGIKGTTMSAWKSVLTEAQIQAVVTYVRRVFIVSPATAAKKSALSAPGKVNEEVGQQ